jgi:ABC-type antimicrobial peptide transport system permease subunit
VLAVVGIGAGLIGSAVLTRVMAGLLFGVSATDALTFGSVAAILAAVAFAASFIPARRATSVDPMTALREE